MTDIKALLCAAEDCARPHATRTDCAFCNTKGVPILPVRYAVHPNAPVQPPAQVRPQLPTAPTPDGYLTLAAHRYTLRLLRPGYLYLFDQRQSRLAGWQVTMDAKYQAYALNNTDDHGVPHAISRTARVDEAPAHFTCQIADHHVPASMIHWPVKGTATVWLMFSELPIPTATLHTLTNNAAWRSAHMQPVTLTAPSGPNIFPPNRIPELLAEHVDNSPSTYAPHAHIRDNVLGANLGTTFADYLTERQARTGEQGVMVALKDDLGVLETLNHNRHQPEQVFNATVGHAPDKDAFQCTAAELEARRKLQSYNVFNMLMQQVADKGQTETAGYQATHTRTQGRTTVGGVVSAPAGHAVSGVTRAMTPEEHRQSVSKGVEKAQQKLRDNFHEYVNVADFQAFKARLEQAVRQRDRQLTARDRDYTEWLIQRTPALQQAVGWMKDSPITAAFLMPIMLRCLMGNVMTEHSHRLWHDHLLKPDASSLLVSALGLQDPAIVQQLTEKLTADESNFLDSLLTGKNLIKVSKALHKYVSKVGTKLIQETTLALLSRPLSVMKTFSQANIQSLHKQWAPLLTRFNNLYRHLNGQTVLHLVELSMPASDHYNFVRSLPKQLSAAFEPGNLREVATYQDNEGYQSQMRHRPYDLAAAKPKEPTVAMYLLVEHADLKSLERFEHGGERLCTASIAATGESFKLHAREGRKLQMAFANLNRQSLMQMGNSAVGAGFAAFSLYGALKKGHDTPEDLVGLVSSTLGMVKATTGLIDVTRQGMTVAGEAVELRLFAEARWCKQMGQAGSLLGIVSTGFELIHIAQAARDGEPGRVVQWQLAGSGLSVATAVLGFLSLTASVVLVIGVVSIALGVLFTELASQAMTLAQRLWVHRGVFGLHHHRYHDSEAFGGTSGTGALVYLDRMTNALQIKHPFGGAKPFGLESDAVKAYHEKALNEETEALAMLVSGITLTVTTMPIDLEDLKDTPEVAETIRQEHGEVTALAQITLSVPEKIDGFIKLELLAGEASGSPFELRTQSLTSVVYKKQGSDFMKNSGDFDWDLSITKSQSTYVANKMICIQKNKYRLSFSFSTIDSQYVPTARDVVVFKG